MRGGAACDGGQAADASVPAVGKSQATSGPVACAAGGIWYIMATVGAYGGAVCDGDGGQAADASGPAVGVGQAASGAVACATDVSWYPRAQGGGGGGGGIGRGSVA